MSLREVNFRISSSEIRGNDSELIIVELSRRIAEAAREALLEFSNSPQRTQSMLLQRLKPTVQFCTLTTLNFVNLVKKSEETRL